MGTLIQDLQYALRLLRKNRGFTGIAILSLAVTIGANTAIFSLLNAVLLRELPVSEPGRLVQLSTVSRKGEARNFSIPIFRELERQQQSFSVLFGWWGDAVLNVEANGTLSRADIWTVTGKFYSGLDVPPLVGRLINPQDVQLDGGAAEQVAVLGYSFWRRTFAGDPSAVNKTIRIEGVPFTIVGIMRDRFTGMSIGTEPDVTIPLTAQPIITDGDLEKLGNRRWFGLGVAGRLKAGVTPAQARVQLESVWPRVQEAMMPPDYSTPEREDFLTRRLELKSAARGIDSNLRSRYTRPLYAMLGITALILLVACVNLTSLTLVRITARRLELGVRVALGAGRWRAMSQLLTENLLLSTGGALLGLVLAYLGSRWLANFVTQNYAVPHALNVSPDLRVLAFTASTSILTVILCGLGPLWLGVRQSPAALLGQNSRTFANSSARFGKILIAIQVALSFVVLVGADLFVETLQKLRAIDPGFRSEGVLWVKLTDAPAGYKNINDDSYYPELVRQVSNLPGVISASLANIRPAGDSEWKQWVSTVPQSTASKDFQADFAVVSPRFFETLGMNLLQGRDFDWKDDDHAPRVAILSRNLAERLFPSGEVIGRHIRIGAAPERQSIVIVGVASNARLFNIRKPNALAVCVPFLQEPKYIHWNSLYVRSIGDPETMSETVRREVQSFGHEYALWVSPLVYARDLALMQERLNALLSASLGLLALLLTSIGLYGLMSYTVTRRTREIGVRIALGASGDEVLGMVLRETVALILVGIMIGTPVALGATKLVVSMLFGLALADPLRVILVALVLLLVGTLAAYLPARRATKVDPMVALRYE